MFEYETVFLDMRLASNIEEMKRLHEKLVELKWQICCA